ncbi:PAAR domain-containing protein [Providencia rettgeri]|nr:PAAR domain-containing protein [Providencia rettgeri]
MLTASSLAKQTQGVACGATRFIVLHVKNGTIVEGDSLMKINGIPVALEGHKVACGCSEGCILIADSN